MQLFRYSLSILIISFLSFSLLSCDDQPTQVDDGDPADDFSHTTNPGNSNEAFVTDDDFDELVVEVHYMPGYEPEQASLDNLQDFLEQHLEKSSITILTPEEIPSGEQESYSADDIRDLEDEHRSTFTEGSQLASYAIFVDGEFDQSSNVLGIAYYNTSTAYFGETIDNISGGATQPSRTEIESTVFNHEFGHLMGLVDNGTDMQEDHQENGPHCTEEECVMYHQVNTTDFFANLFDDSIPELDDFCVADIEALKE